MSVLAVTHTTPFFRVYLSAVESSVDGRGGGQGRRGTTTESVSRSGSSQFLVSDTGVLLGTPSVHE